MIVERWTWKAKVGRRDELIELAKAWVERYGLTGRVCTFEFGGTWNIVFVDVEFETMQDQQKFWDDYDWSRPEAIETLKKFQNLWEPDSTHELLVVH